MMEQMIAYNIIRILTGCMIIAMVIIYFSNSTKGYLKSYIFQSLCLIGLTVFLGYYLENEELFLNAIITFITEIIVIPLIITAAIKKIQLVEEKEPFTNIALSLIVFGGLFVILNLIIAQKLVNTTAITQNILPTAIAIVLLGFFMIASKKKANAQIFGLLIMENGIHLAILATIYNLIIIVEIGVAIDVVIGIAIMW